MSNEEYTELLALIGQQLKESGESRLEWARRHDQLMQAMLNGFLRFDIKFDALTDRVDSLGNRVDSLGVDMREVKEQLGHLTYETYAIRTRLDATFNQVGHLTEHATSTDEQLADLRRQNREMEVRLDQRMQALEDFVNKP